MSRRHIVHIIPTLGFGGAERLVVDMVNGGDHHHMRYSIFVLKPHTPLAEHIQKGAAEVRLIPKRGKISIGLFFALRAALKRAKPDIVHTHLFGGDVWGRIAAWSLGIPVVTTEHNIDLDVGRVRQVVKRILAPLSQEYIACSEAIKKFVVETYGVPARKIRVIRSGVSVGHFRHVKKPVFAEPIRFLILGRQVPQKGIDVALEAFSECASPAWTLDIVGEGVLHNDLRDHAHMLGISGSVKFFPATTRVAEVLEAHDVLLVPSRWEGLGVVVMEAMAAGRVVIVSNVGGLPELVNHGETGYIVPSGDANTLKQAIQFMIEHPEKARGVAEKAQAYAVAHFDAPRMIAAYEAVYRNIRV
jgi:glycosyltransferase involved in cell wall biosynthesis